MEKGTVLFFGMTQAAVVADILESEVATTDFDENDTATLNGPTYDEINPTVIIMAPTV